MEREPKSTEDLLVRILEQREGRLRQLHLRKSTAPAVSEPTEQEISAKQLLERGSRQPRYVEKADTT